MDRYIVKDNAVLEYYDFIQAYIFIGYLEGKTLFEFIVEYEETSN